jgi:hypothetical protein
MYPVVEPDSPLAPSPESPVDSDLDAVDAELVSSPSTFGPHPEHAAGARLPAILDLFVGWVVRDKKGWVRRL